MMRICNFFYFDSVKPMKFCFSNLILEGILSAEECLAEFVNVSHAKVKYTSNLHLPVHFSYCGK